MDIEGDPLFKRAEAALAEASRLRLALEQVREQILRQVEEMARIEAELDPILPHPPGELRAVRELLAAAANP